MKKINIAYWIISGLFALAMIGTSIGNVTSNPDSIKFIVEGLGFPAYMVPFLGVAKITGSIVILIPGLKRLKEWAYAGLFFDLAGALFAIISKHGVKPDLSFMLLFFVLLFGSYYLWIKKETQEQ